MNTASHFERRMRDWLLLLAGAVLLAVLLASLNWILFVRTPAPNGVSPVADTPSFSREKLDSVLADFERRRLEYENPRTPSLPIADPGK